MSEKPVGRLQRVALRELWKSESADFTPWLGQEENIALLSEALGMELTVEGVEEAVGSFSADIVCSNTADHSKVLIENQLERTDHTHLGQILTYAAGLDAVTIVWIARNFTDEHRAALDWLNRVTEEGFNFFGLEVELWRIGDSPVAPKFNVVARPNEWTRTVRELGEKGAAQRNWVEYWTSFAEFVARKGGPIKPPRPSPSYWVGWGLGRTGFSLVALVAFRDRHADVRVEMMGSEGKAHFHLLLAGC